MENKTLSKYHLPLLLFIPLVVLTGFFIKRGEVDLQMHDQYFVTNAVSFVLVLSSILGIKALFYFKTSSYSLYSKLCWTDVGLTLIIGSLLLYSGLDGLLGNDFNKNGMIFLNLGIATWMLMQFLVFVNYFILMFYGSKK